MTKQYSYVKKGGKNVPQHLKGKDLSSRSKEDMRALASKGGKTVTEKQLQAAKLRGIKVRIKNGNIKSDDAGWLLARLEDPKAMDLDILALCDEIKATLHPNQRVSFLNALTQAKKAIHGEKSINHNLNVNIDMDEWEKRMMKE